MRATSGARAPRESALQARCLKWCRDEGLLALNVHGGGWTLKGFPDLLVFGRGRVCAAELKSGNGYRQQDDQKVWQARLERAGVPVAVPDTFEGFKAFVERSIYATEGPQGDQG